MTRMNCTECPPHHHQEGIPPGADTGQTQEQVAAKIGVDQSTVADWESENGSISNFTITSIPDLRLKIPKGARNLTRYLQMKVLTGNFHKVGANAPKKALSNEAPPAPSFLS